MTSFHLGIIFFLFSSILTDLNAILTLLEQYSAVQFVKNQRTKAPRQQQKAQKRHF